MQRRLMFGLPLDVQGMSINITVKLMTNSDTSGIIIGIRIGRV